ncbi:MAG: hypothetical protein Ct9H300mP4_13400 [Gammaproteobacteria bacterium]|nr:MAG: hypothetical protein Ct9H300mP4_13400 [Gammaproteobacteria bacterium]
MRQPNFILNVPKQNKPMNIKKGQFLSPWEMQNVVDKAKSGITKMYWFAKEVTPLVITTWLLICAL